MNHYVSIFKNSKVVSVMHYGDAGPGPKGTVMSATFQLDGQEFIALNGGSQFKFTEAILLFVSCETQEEVDDLWEKLAAGGKKERCDFYVFIAYGMLTETLLTVEPTVSLLSVTLMR